MSELDEVRYREPEIKRIGIALHDLCQPLTTLQCRLEMAEMIGTPDAHREAVHAGLAECQRMVAAVSSMREIVRAAAQDSTGDQERVAG